MSRYACILLHFGLALGLNGQDFFSGGTSARSAGRAGIYVPSGDNALDALVINPAGLTSLTGPVIDLGARGLFAQGDFSNAANRNSPMRRTLGATPFGAFGIPLGKRWTVAAGVTPDFLSTANWQFRDAPGVAGADYGPLHEKSQITAFRTSVGVAYRISRYFSAGVTVGALYNANTLVMPYVFQSHPALKGLKTLLDLHTTGVGWNTSFGVIARPNRYFEFGAAYRTQSTIVSHGDATGNIGVQFAALQIPFRPDFAYKAQVQVDLPQSVLVSATWKKSPVLRFSLQTGWTDWSRGFASLPVTLTNGTNTDINQFLQSTSLKDSIPLHWKDQYSVRAAVERNLGERFSVSGGYRHQNNSVPSSTLSPLTAAIMKDGLSTGAGYVRGPLRFNLAYEVNLPSAQKVGKSALQSGEFSQSRVRIWTQGLTLSTSFRL